MTILLQTEIIENINDTTELLNVLSFFDDEDFNGNNGKVYLWEEAEKLGYESNQEFVICHFVDNIKLTPQEKIAKYFDMWLGGNAGYEDYDWILKQVKGDTYALTLVRITED